MSDVSFKERVCAAIINSASIYESIFLHYEYLIYSSNFSIRPYYVINGILNNYLHLTGVNTSLSTYDFYIKSLDGTLTESDFNFIKSGKSEKSVKGSVREKIIALPLLETFFTMKLKAEEDFSKSVMSCSLATTDNVVTVGFVNVIDSKPKTLLKGNVLDPNKAVDISLVLRRNKDSDKFDTIVQGDVREFCDLFPDMFVCNLDECRKNQVN